MSAYFTVDLQSPSQYGRLIPADVRTGSAIASQAFRLTSMFGVAGQPNMFVNDSIRKSHLDKVGPTAIRKAACAAWDSMAQGYGGALAGKPYIGTQDSFTVAPAGSAYLDVVGRLTEVAMQPRPPMLFDQAFPDRIAFASGQEYVFADCVQTSGRPKIGWKGSINDLPTFQQSIVTTPLGTVWAILDIPLDMQAEARSRLSAAALSPTDLVSNGLTELERSLDYVGWNGDLSAGVYGLLNHPFLPRYQDVAIDLSSSTSSAIYASMIAAATYAQANSKGAGKIDQVVMSYKIRVALESNFISIGGVGVAMTLLEAVENAFKRLGISVVQLNNDVVWPLDDVGGTGVHGMLFSCSEPSRRPGRLWAMETTAFPDQSNPLISHTYAIANFGDVHIRRADSILLALFAE